MTKTIQISDSTFEKMQEVAIPLEDDADTLLSRILDFYISQNHGQEVEKKGSTVSKLVLDPYAPADLSHSKIRKGKFGDRRISGRNWSQLVKIAHETMAERGFTFEDIQQTSPFNVKKGEYNKRGYHFFPGAGVSVQYKSAPDVWEGCLKIAEALEVPIDIEFEWLDKEGASHPEKRGHLSWEP